MERHPDVVALANALQSADAAAAFREPRLVLGALHLLYRAVITWPHAKRMDHARSRKENRFRQNTRQALVTLVQRTESDASDAADRASKARKWISSDHEKRYFGASRMPRLRVSGTRAVCIAASDTEVVAWRRQRLPDVLALRQWPGRRTRPPDSPSLCGSPADDDASRPRSAREHATYFPHRD